MEVSDALPQLEFESSALDRLTHYAFRYPAKFHPPVVKQLLTKFTEVGQTCFDPFCGSGTLLVEAAAADILNIVTSSFKPAAVQAAVEELLNREVSRSLYVQVVDVLRQIFADNFLKQGDPRSVDQVAALLASRGVATSKGQVKAALGEIASASQGLLRMNKEQILLLGELDELERRLSQLTGRQGPPRQAGTFRAPE